MTDTVPQPPARQTPAGQTPVAARLGGKVDRDEVFFEYTRSICPVCKTVIDAQVNIRAGKVYLRKRCAVHGWFEALVYGDARRYVEFAKFNKPGTLPLIFQTEVKDGCPSDCGLCPEHKQHACLGIIEVNTGCNLDCPICFADSGHQPNGYSITLAQCQTMLDTFVASEGDAEVVMFSGGEPTIHTHILEFIDAAQARPIRNVNVNTNGIRLASDRAFVAELGERNRRDGRSVNIYLQFDGLDEATHRQIRGRDLRKIKQRALDNCATEGLTVTLVAAIEKNVNEHECGPIIAHGLAHPAVRSVAFQPVTHAGRHVEFDPLTRLTNSDVIELVAVQLPDYLRVDDFFPVPCCFPACRSITYLFTQGNLGDPTSAWCRCRDCSTWPNTWTTCPTGSFPTTVSATRWRNCGRPRPLWATATPRTNSKPRCRLWTAPTRAGSTCPKRWATSPSRPS
jgi:hypothetical protein